MSCREVYQQEIMLSSIQMEQVQKKVPQITQKLPEKVEDILKEALDVIEDKQNCSQFVKEMDLFSLIEEGFSETNSLQGAENNCLNTEIEEKGAVENIVSIDQDDDNGMFYEDDNEQFHQDSGCTAGRQIFSPWFSDPLLSSHITHTATMDHIYKQYSPPESSELR